MSGSTPDAGAGSACTLRAMAAISVRVPRCPQAAVTVTTRVRGSHGGLRHACSGGGRGGESVGIVEAPVPTWSGATSWGETWPREGARGRGAIALYAATQTNASRVVLFGRLARLGLGVCAISFMLGQALLLRKTAHLVPKWIPPNQTLWAILTTVAFGLAALATLSNRQARLAMRLMTLMLALFGLMVWIPRLIGHPTAHFSWSECALTFLVTGAAWVVAELKCFLFWARFACSPYAVI